MSGAGVFESMAASAGDLPLWPIHLERLSAGAAVLGIASQPPKDLRQQARALLQRSGDDVLRLSLTPAADGAQWGMTTRRRSGPSILRLHPLLGDRAGDPLAAIKATERALYDELAARARAAGADDALLVGADGCVRETTICNVFARRRGRWWTPPLDGTFLPGIARALLVEALAKAGTPVHEVCLTVEDLAQAEALVVTNAVWGPRPAWLGGSGPVVDIAPLPDMWRRHLAEPLQ